MTKTPPETGVASGYDLAGIAAKIRIGHKQVATIHDRLVEKYGGDSLQLLYVLASKDASPALLALEQAQAAGWLKELLQQLIAARAFPELEDDESSDEDSSTGALGSAESRSKVELQGIVNPDGGMWDCKVYGSGNAKAFRRVCHITVQPKDEAPSYGSGFLVGPQVVLTAWHVVRRLLEPGLDGGPLPQTNEKITVRFDKIGADDGVAFEVAENWLVSASRAHDLEVQQGTDLLDLSAHEPTGFEAHLDYALILLKKPVGRQRGFYTLDPARKPIVTGSGRKIMIFHHPAGYSMKCSDGAATALWPARIETRLKHDSATTGGSSGGLILDRHFEPVALHQCGVRDKTGQALFNGAIPTACIAANENKFYATDGVDAIWKVESTGAPVFGRELLQELILDAITADIQIIAIQGPDGSGRTFSLQILQDRLGTSDHILLEMNSWQIPHQAHDFVNDVLRRLGLPAADLEKTPTPEQADTARPAWHRDVLLPYFREMLGRARDDQLVWIVIDDLNQAPLHHSSTRAFLALIYQQIEFFPFLRFVLIGATDELWTAPPKLVAYEHLQSISAEDVQATIERALIASGQDSAPAAERARTFYEAQLQNGQISPKALATAFNKMSQTLLAERAR
jgi:hypothetical protein